MKKWTRIKGVIIACALSLSLIAPVCIPAVGNATGEPVITSLAKSSGISIKAAKKKLKKKIKAKGYKKNYRIDLIKAYKSTYCFYIVTCTSCCGCYPVGYAEVDRKTGKVQFEIDG